MTVLPFVDDHQVLARTPTGGASNVRFVRVTLLSNTQGGGQFIDLSEFSVYAGPAASVDVTAPPTPTPTPTATASPIPTAMPTVVPTPVPTVTPKATLRLDPSGRRAVKLRVTCPVRCTLSAKLAVSTSTAKRLGLGKTRTIGTARRTLAAGSTTTITVALTGKAKQRLTKSRLKSFKATFTASAGGTNARRTVTVRR